MILGALEYADHPTATELYEMVRQKNEHISKATVFRVLAQSAENGDILKVHLCGTDERYDATIMPHAHVRCVYCGKKIPCRPWEFPGCIPLEKAPDMLAGLYLPQWMEFERDRPLLMALRAKRNLPEKVRGFY